MRTGTLAGILLSTAIAGCAAPPSDPAPAPPANAALIASARAVIGGRAAELRYASTHHSLVGDHVRFHHLAADGTVVVDRDVAVSIAGAQGTVADDHPAPFHVVGARSISAAEAREQARAAVPAAKIVEQVTEAERVAIPVAMLDHDRGDLAAEAADDPDAITPGYSVDVQTAHPAHRWQVLVDGTGHAVVHRDHYHFAAQGYVYDPNPVAQSGDTTLRDNSGATSATLDALRIPVALANLDGTHVLKGTYVDAHPKSAARATDPDDQFMFDRSSLHFDETMAYYHLDRAQTRLTDTLGFTDANHRQQIVLVDGESDDNSMYDDSSKRINYGTGGVDDAQDADVVLHEYGHAIQDNIVPGWGASSAGGAMGEGWGDLHAASAEPVDAAGHPMKVARECLAAWDATAYDADDNPPCLRRLDGTKHYPEGTDGEVHDDGEIWSAAMWQMYAALGDKDLGEKLVVQSFFGLTANTTMQKQADSLVAADVALDGGAHVDAIRKVTWARGLDRTPLPGTNFGVSPTITPMALASPSPLPNNANDSLTVHQDGAAALSVHFASFSTEKKGNCFGGICDYVYIFDGTGHLYGVEGGAKGAHDSAIVPGDTMVIRWVTNGSGSSTGFTIDSIAWAATVADMPDANLTPPPDAAIIDAPPVTIDAPHAVDAPEPDIDAPPVGPGLDASGSNAETSDGGANKTGGNGGCCSTGGGGGAGSLLLGLASFGHVVRRRRRGRRDGADTVKTRTV